MMPVISVVAAITGMVYIGYCAYKNNVIDEEARSIAIQQLLDVELKACESKCKELSMTVDGPLQPIRR